MSAIAESDHGIRIRVADININTLIYLGGIIVAIVTFYVNVNNKFDELTKRQDSATTIAEALGRSLDDLTVRSDRALGNYGTVIGLHAQRLNTLDVRDSDFAVSVSELRDAIERQREVQGQMNNDVRLVLQMLRERDMLPGAPFRPDGNP